MKEKKVHGLKHYLMLVLVSIVNIVYHTNVSAYLCSTSMTTPSGYLVCLNVASFNLCSPSEFCSLSSYLCVTASEYASLGNNTIPYCSSYSTMAGFENTKGNACYNKSFSLTNYTCDCNSGYRGTGTSCVACGYGNYCYNHKVSVSKAASTCPPGTYQSLNTQSTCNPCSPGTYQNGSYPTRCAECNTGYYQPNSMQSACIAASAGHYVPSAGVNTKQIPCSIGYYTNKTGQSTCSPCPMLSIYEGNSGFTYQGTTSTTGAVIMLQCYLAANNISQTDNIGTWINRSDCPYTT